MDITGTSAIVTGGASGLGEATSRRLAAAGAKVVVLDMQDAKGEPLAKELGGVFVHADVTNTEEVQAAVDAASEMGPLRYTFRREGEYWTIVFDGRTSRLRDRIGFRHLAMLLRRPGVRVPAFELAPGSSRGTEGARVRVTKAMRTAIACIASTDPAFGAHLRATIRLGTGCAYLPTDLDARTWEVEV